MRRIIVLAVTVAAVSAVASEQALAAVNACIGGPATTVTTPNKAGACPTGKKLFALALESEVTTLQARVSTLESQVGALKTTLSKVSYNPSGLNGQPTLEISGANVQIDNGAGITNSTNGLGNLFIGYDENSGQQTGSHNLVLGFNQAFTSWAGVVAGEHNTVTGEGGAAFGGFETVGPGPISFAAGGSNTAAGDADVVFGQGNLADGSVASVLGGHANKAHGVFTSILGGFNNTVTANCETFPSTGESC